ncbi:MAG TPA: TolC family protein [Bryobacteraceae bacterium]|jgi:outer membrane protein TolC|nr:TolC family protein [Bryobacteraceae bacterium]
MRFLSLIAGMGLWLCGVAHAQAPPAPNASLQLTLQDALERARANAQTLLAATNAAQIAHEDTVQAKAALLPTANWFNQFIYTQPNGTLSGVFVPNDGPHVYYNTANVHGDLFAPGKRADYHRAEAAEAVARAKADIAARGLYATVVQDYYALVTAARKYANAQQNQREAEQFLDITQKQEQGGEVAHSDVVTAQILVEQRRRDTQDALLAEQKARLGLAVLVFPEFRQDFTVADDLETATALPDFQRVQSMASTNNPDIRAAMATVQQQEFEIKSARSALYPTLSLDYFFGIEANQYALHNRDGQNQLGSAVQATLNIPVWNWGATRSKIRQSELRLKQAQTDLSLTQRELLANLNSLYREADLASMQIASLRRSLDLSNESLRLTLLRYQAGEVTVLEVKDAQTTLVQARNAADDGLVRYRAAIANLQTLTGTF